MSYKIQRLNTIYVNDKTIVSFRYWVKGECACTAKKRTHQFNKNPTDQEIIKLIS